MATADPERSEALILKLVSDAGLQMPDEVRRELSTGRLTLLWHEQRLAVVVEDDEDDDPSA
jgi:hypothetical protein